MKRAFWKGLLCVSVSFFIGMMYAASQKPWTFLVYMAAANDLNQYALLDLHQMMQAGSNDNVNIIVYLTIQEDGQPKVTKKLYVEQGALKQIGEVMVRDSGDLVVLEEALLWACNDYPSDYIAVVLWGDGSGPLNKSHKIMPSRGFCYDRDTEYYLTEHDCLEAFSWARDYVRDGKKFDIIAFDTSFSASLEMAYALSFCADYMVASQDDLSDHGYQYAYILNQFATQTFDPLSFAQLMVSVPHQEEYAEIKDYIFSVIDLNVVHSLVDNCNALAHVLLSQLMGKHRVIAKATIKKCININNCPSFDEGMYIDLWQFYKNVLKHSAGLHVSKSCINQFKQLLNNGIKLFANVVKAHVMSGNYQQAGGISIYFSRYSLDPSYYGLYWAKQNPNWLNFLEAFLL